MNLQELDWLCQKEWPQVPPSMWSNLVKFDKRQNIILLEKSLYVALTAAMSVIVSYFVTKHFFNYKGWITIYQFIPAGLQRDLSWVVIVWWQDTRWIGCQNKIKTHKTSNHADTHTRIHSHTHPCPLLAKVSKNFQMVYNMFLTWFRACTRGNLKNVPSFPNGLVR